jgi:hypothetical protein
MAEESDGTASPRCSIQVKPALDERPTDVPLSLRIVPIAVGRRTTTSLSIGEGIETCLG